MGLNRRGSEREFDWSSSPCSLTLPLTLQVQEKKIPGTTVTGRWLKQDAHRKHRIAPRVTWHALRSVESRKRCSTRDVAPKARTANLKTSRPVLVLYFPTNGKAFVVLERTATQPHGKRSAAYLQGCPFAWSFGVFNFFWFCSELFVLLRFFNLT